MNWSDYIEVVSTSNRGYGVLAKTRIPKGTAIVQYVGVLMPREEADASFVKAVLEGKPFYEMAISNVWTMDGNVAWNPARLLNHSCEPNTESRFTTKKFTYPIRDGGTATLRHQTWLRALRDIEVGEELTYDYEVPYDREYTHKLKCLCGCASCVGFIVKKSQRNKVATTP